MNTTGLLGVIGIGVTLEILAFVLLRFLTKLDGKAMATIIALGVIGVFIPWVIINWPGGDVFAIEIGIFLVVAYVLGIIGRRAGKSWHWGPALIFGFFVFVIAVNVIFVTLAETGITGIFSKLLPEPQTSTVANSRFPGTVSHDFQEKEALYNAYLRDVVEQQERGWQVRKGWQRKPVVGEPERDRPPTRAAVAAEAPGAVAAGRRWSAAAGPAGQDMRSYGTEQPVGVQGADFYLGRQHCGRCH